jgi:trimeric autotransporter adhesin
VPAPVGLNILGSTAGDTLRYNGTDWVRNNLLYNNGTAIGVGTQNPGYILDVAGTVNFLGFRMPTGASSGMVLTSDTSGLARWSSTPIISASGITWGTQDYVTKFGPGWVGLSLSQIFDNGSTVGINTVSPTAGYRMDIVWADILVHNLRIGRWGGNILSNTAFWWSALGTNATATTSVAIGYAAFSTLSAGGGNIGIGNLAGSTLTSGSNNILIGNNAQPSWATASNELNIGNWIYGSGGFIGIGVSNPGARLQVAWQIKITGGSPAVGRFLTTDATWLASWADVVATNVYATGVIAMSSSGGYITKFMPSGSGITSSLFYESGSYIGLGTTNPLYTLHVSGTGNFTGLRLPTGAGSGKVLVSDTSGAVSWQSGVPSSNAWLLTGNTGTNSGNFLWTLDSQDLAMKTNNTERLKITGVGNIVNPTAIVWSSLQKSLVFGEDAGFSEYISGVEGYANIALWGRYVGWSFDGAYVWFTDSALTMSGSYNIALGWQAAGTNMIGTMNSALGWYRPWAYMGWSQNTAVWWSQPWNWMLWSQNIALGWVTSWDNMAWSSNVGIWWESAWYFMAWYENTAIWWLNAWSYMAWLRNIALWSYAWSGMTWESNVFIGTYAVWNLWQDNQFSLGNVIYGSGMGSGGLSSGRVGIGTMNPWAKLEVAGQVKITWWSPWVGKLLSSDATGLATWSSGFSGTTTSSGITGWSGFYIPYFGTWGNGLYPSFMYYTGGKMGINTTTPTYMFDVQWSGSIIRAGSGFCLGFTASGCVTNWSDLNNIVKSTGTPNYIAKFDTTTGLITNSQLYETGWDLWIGNIPSILGGGATKWYITVESFGSTNSARPLLTLSENGGQECRMWINGANKMWSNCAWTAWAIGFGFLPNQVPRADATTGDSLTGGTIFNVWDNVGIGISSGLAANLHVSGSTLVTGNLTVQWKVITDTIVNRTVNNVSISGSILPDAGAPLVYRNIGSNTQRWNDLYLSGQVTIAWGTPWLGKILTSDANGLASWSSSISWSTATGITGGVQNYVSKFGTWWNGLYASQIFDNGSNIGIGTGTSLSTKFTIDSGINNDSGLQFARLNLSSPLTSNGVLALWVNASGKVLPISPISNIAVYTWVLRTTVLTPNPDLNTFNITYDFNQYFAIPGKQSFVVSKWDGASNNGPYFKENGTSGLCTRTDPYANTLGTWNNPYDCPDADPATWLSASPYNSFTMSAKWDTFGYQLALGARGDAPLFARSGRFNGAQTGWLFTNDSPYQTPAPWQRVLSVPANHPEYLFINTWLNSQLQAITGGWNIGIGTTTPTSRFEVWTGSSTSPLLHFRSTNSVGLGLSALKVNNTGNSNTAIGAETLFTLTNGYSNTAIGYKSLRTNGAGYNNSAIGQETLFSNNGGSWNNALGYQALYSNSSGTGNIGIGWQALYNISTGNQNIALGYQALRAVAGSSISNNIAIGYSALYSSTTSNLTAVGYQALYSNTSGTGNTAIWYSSLDGVTTGYNNTALGYSTLDVATGNQNVAIGANAGSTLTSGSNNIVIGADKNLVSTTASNQLNIGNWIYGSGGNIGIGTWVLTWVARLVVDGQIKITGWAVWSWRVLVTDSTGLWFWRDVTTLWVWWFNYVWTTDYSSLNTIWKAPDVTDMVFQLADNATDGWDRFVFQMDQWSGDVNQRYPIVMNGLYAAFDPRYSLNFNSSTQNYGSGTMLSATAYMDYATRRFGIGTMTPATTLDVTGNFKLGTNGTQLNAIIKANVVLDVPSIASLACSAQTLAVTNATVWWTATVSPGNALTDRMIIAYARVSAANTVEVKFCNESVAAIDLASMTYYVSVIQ